MHPCPCCGDRCGAVYTDDPDDMCDDCLAAGCDPDGDTCDVSQCEHCEEFASFMTDCRWHSNCEDDCTNHGKSWTAELSTISAVFPHLTDDDHLRLLGESRHPAKP
jgi:hypothetical protein